MNTYIFHVTGTHCHACKVLIEDIIGEQPGITKVSVNLSKQIVTVEADTEDAPETLASEWSKLLEVHKYRLSLEKQHITRDVKSLGYAIPLGLFVLGLFFLLQRSGIVNFGVEGGLTAWTAFLVGVIASFSTCLAVVGGLVLSLSAEISQDVSTSRPFLFFHVGRIVSFMLLGGLLGAAGSIFVLSTTITTFLGILVALVMIILGVNLLDIFHFSKKFQLALPRHFFDRLTKMENGAFAPFVLGTATFFLPCGFTQSMQLAALSSGSFWLGGMIMTMFAFGTLPMLAVLSFGSFRFAHTRYAPLFFKTAGVVVIGLGIFSLLAALAGMGIIKPLFNI